MNKRPPSVTLISWVFIALGVIPIVINLLPPIGEAAAQHLAEARPQHPVQDVLIAAVRLLAVLGGTFMLRGANWARWLLLAWVGFHIYVGFLHSVFAGLVHGGLFSVMAYCLFRLQVTDYFRGGKRLGS